MNPILKIHRALYTALLQELRRPHPFAWERVSFLTANAGQDGELVLPTVQYPVPDDQYVPDTTSAACIGSAAIRAAISRALTEQVSIFHVHLHDHLGAPWFSHIDLSETPRIVASCQAVAPSRAHGMLVLSATHIAGLVWSPGHADPQRFARVVIVGYPTEVL